MNIYYHKLKAEDEAKVKAFVSEYKAAAEKRQKNTIASEFAIYLNKNLLATDLICANCASAEKAIELAAQYYAEAAKQEPKKKAKERPISTDTITE
jgi:hypothetical protein